MDPNSTPDESNASPDDGNSSAKPAPSPSSDEIEKALMPRVTQRTTAGTTATTTDHFDHLDDDEFGQDDAPGQDDNDEKVDDFSIAITETVTDPAAYEIAIANSESNDGEESNSDPETMGFAEELGITNLMYPLQVGRGRLFSAAGPRAPVAEFTEEFVVMHPPQMPFMDEGPSEDIVIRVDSRGVLLDELGVEKHIAGAKFRGHALWYSGEQKPGTLKHYVIWFDSHSLKHKLYVNSEPLTSDVVYRLRNKTHDGELSIFPDITTDESPQS